MAVTFFSPYGTLTKESGFMYMFARYLSAFYDDVYQLKCNGLFTICNRDCLDNEKRNFLTCGKCMACQNELASWACIKSKEISTFFADGRIWRAPFSLSPAPPRRSSTA